MPVDASIALQGRLPEFENPLNQLAKFSQVQAYQKQNKLAEMAMAAKEREAAQETAYNAAYKSAVGPDGKINTNSLYSALATSGAGSKIPDLQKTFADRDKSVSDAELAQYNAGIKKAEWGAQILSSAKDQNSYNLARQRTAEVFGPEAAARMPEAFDPQFVSGKLNEVLTIKDQMEQQWKQKDYSLKVDQFGETKRHNRTQEGISRGNLGVAQANLGMSRERLEFDKSKKGQVANMSATMQKELFEADDGVQSSRNVIDLLNTAQKLNDKAYSGVGATTRAAVWSHIPGVDATSANATIDLDNIMTGQALESLKGVFGGMPTEGERKILMDMQASADKTPAQRKTIMDRAIKAAEKRLQFNASKAESLRSGTYNAASPASVGGNASGLSAEEQKELAELRKRLGR